LTELHYPHPPKGACIPSSQDVDILISIVTNVVRHSASTWNQHPVSKGEIVIAGLHLIPFLLEEKGASARCWIADKLLVKNTSNNGVVVVRGHSGLLTRNLLENTRF